MKKLLIISFLSLFSVSIIFAGTFSYDHNYGQVSRIYADDTGIYFSLSNGETQQLTSYGEVYYKLEKSHDNYSVLVSILLLAQSTDQVLKVRTNDDSTIVRYMIIDK